MPRTVTQTVPKPEIAQVTTSSLEKDPQTMARDLLKLPSEKERDDAEQTHRREQLRADLEALEKLEKCDMILIPEELKLYSMKTVGSILSLSPQTVRKLVKSGQLKAYQLGRKKLLVSHTDLVEWMGAKRYKA